MKTKHLLLFLLLAALAPRMAWSQTFIEINGTEVTNDHELPLVTDNNYSLSEQIYTSAELGNIGTSLISSIEFFNTTNATFSRSNVDIYIVHTDKDHFEVQMAGFSNDCINVTSADLVFHGQLNFSNAWGWNTITLNTPFCYDGHSNICIVVDDNTGSSSSNPLGRFNSFTTPIIQTLVKHGTYNYDPTNNVMGGDTRNRKNPIRLQIEPLKTHIAAAASDTAMTWDEFAANVNNGVTYNGLTLFLDEDITTSTMVGNTSNLFGGTFDGQGHTITFNKGTSSSRFNEEDCAPFRHVSGATIKNLKATGAIYTSVQFASGFVARVSNDGVTFINCESNITINSYRTYENAQARHAGFIARHTGGAVSFEGCSFTGQLVGNYGEKDWGGFVAHFAVGQGTVELSNCVFAPTQVNVNTSGSFTFARPSSGSSGVTTTNCYYTQTLGTAQGKLRYTITEESPVFADLNGTPTTHYMSHITGYSGNAGLIYDGTIIAGSGDQVSLNLSGSNNGYLADHGTLTGTDNPYTLSMAAYNTEIGTLKNHIVNTVTDPLTELTWDEFASNVNNGITYEGLTVYLDEDITTSTMVGTVVNNNPTNPFMGTFDGQGHTLIFNKGTTSSVFNEQYCAPFRYTRGATIKNLKTDGTIFTSNKFAANIVARADGNGNIGIHLINCESAFTLNTSVNGDGTHGGMVAIIGSNASASIEGCAFTGCLAGSNTNACGGFVGYATSNIQFDNCIFYPMQVNVSATNSCTFARSSGVTVTLNNSYYTQTFGTAQGKLRYTVTAEGYVTMEMNGTPTHYDMSHITAYSDNTGLLYNSTIIAGSGDQLSLNLNGSDGGYIADHGTLTGTSNPYTLTMAAYNTVITSLKNHIVNIVIDPNTQLTWDDFAANVNNGITYNGLTIYLDEDITTSTMVGASGKLFQGTFDGQGHTITFTKGTSSSRFNENLCAPFRHTGSVTIKNLKVTGAIYTSKQFAAGIVATTSGIHLINCESNVTINTSVNGDGTHGGMVGYVGSNSSNIEGCAFTGSLIGSSTNACGGLVGYSDSNIQFHNCVFNPEQITVSTTYSCTFARSGNGTVTVNNCYYTRTLGTAQGKLRYTVAAESPVTIEMNGTPTHYDMSHITAYGDNVGLLCDSTIIAGSGEQLSLNLGGSDGGYVADHGTLTGTSNPYTLSMAAYNTTISAPIVFADANVKALCVANWDTNGDGELSYAEAAAVTDLGQVFYNNRTITTFDELQYFTGLSSIENSAFYWCTSLSSIVMPDSVISIGDYAFLNCTSLASVIIPDSVISIGDYAFRFCSGLTSVEIPNSVTYIGNYAFYGCTGLTSVGIPNSVTYIGFFAFANCTGLTSIEIPNSVTYIKGSTFNSCSGLASIVVAPGNTVYDSRDNCNAIIETSTNTLVAGCMNTVIPNTVTTIGNNAFYGCTGMTSVTIPSSVTTIGNNAFYECTGLESITVLATTPPTLEYNSFAYVSSSTPVFIPDGTYEVYSNSAWSRFQLTEQSSFIVFADPVVEALCVSNWGANGKLYPFQAAAVTSLGSVFKRNPDITSFNELQYFTGLTEIHLRDFYNCTSLTSIEIPNSVTYIGSEAFLGCTSLTSVGIPNSVTSIGSFAFRRCSSLASIEIPGSVTSIGDCAFLDCTSLTAIEIPNSVTSIGSRPFQGCTSLASIVVAPDNTVYDSRDNCNAIIETAANELAEGCKATVIPNTVTSIGDWAFYGCTSLTSIEIPSSVIIIGLLAFAECTGLESITVLATTPPILGDNVFYNVDSTIPVYVPCGTLAAYQAHYRWNVFSNIIDPCAEVTQTMNLSTGVNWVSFNVEITLDSLKAALVAAMPVSGVTIAAKDDGQTFYNGTRWRGALASLDMAQMYRITVPAACEIVFEGMPVDPASHPITIKSGLNWIAYPFMESMTITDAFAGFAVSGDEIRAKDDGIAKYVGTRWRGALTNLVPSQGYIYNSAVSGNRTFTFPTSSGK